jgi:predicted CoA-binding protein
MPIEDDNLIREILTKAKTIAVVGASDKPLRDSGRIAEYLKREGYRVIPVNPAYSEVGGEKCYPDLASIGTPVDIADVFRNPETLESVVDDAIASGTGTIWFQLGVINPSAALKAEKAGLKVVMNHCISIDHSRLIK